MFCITDGVASSNVIVPDENGNLEDMEDTEHNGEVTFDCSTGSNIGNDYEATDSESPPPTQDALPAEEIYSRTTEKMNQRKRSLDEF